MFVGRLNGVMYLVTVFEELILVMSPFCHVTSRTGESTSLTNRS